MRLRSCHKGIKRNYKHIAAAFAGVAMLSAAVLPVSHAVRIHAAGPSVGNVSPAPPQTALNEAPETAAKTTQADADAPADYKEVMNVTATAYAPGPQDNDQWGTKTHMGTEVRPGVIAVDPRIIPLGSRVYIKYPDGHGTYAIAEDTGGAIKGHRIDVAKWTVREAKEFGIKPVKLYVLHDSGRSERA